jgi:ribosome maturation factor RimP
VSSPGLDRPLKTPADFELFCGLEISLTLKMPFQGRKVWKGVLQSAESGWNLSLKEGKDEQVLSFVFDEVREARLVPVVDFKGRRNKTAGVVQEPAAKPEIDGGLDR